MEKYRTRAVALWILLSAGFALHCVADVLPIFWSVDVAVDASAQMPQAMLLFMMSLSFFAGSAFASCAISGSFAS